MKTFNQIHRDEELGGDPPPGDGATPPADPPSDPTPSWFDSTPDDWRIQIAGEDEGRLKKLDRYTDLSKFIDSSFQAHDKLRAGEIGSGLPENPTDEQVTAYREANGIPVDGTYNLSLEEGMELSDGDKSIMESVFPVALKGNVSSDVLSAMTSAFMEGRKGEVDNILAQDGIDKQTSDTMLRDNWGGDYDVNTQMVNNLITRELPADMVESFMTARDGGTGKGLFNNPAVMQMFANIERQLNPMSVIPGGGENAAATANDIIAQANEMQRKGEKYPPGFEAKYDAALEHQQQNGSK